MALAPLGREGIVPGGCTEWAADRPSIRASARHAWTALGVSRAGLAAQVSPAWAIGVPVAVVTLIVAGSFLQPAPAEEATGGAAVMEAVIANVLFAGLAATVMGAMSLRRWGIAAGLGISLFAAGLVLSCPVSGHHTWGVWFAGQSACVLGAVAVATMGLVRTRG